ncbi:MAG: septum formation protein Maf [Rhodospirillaceae bacterium]|nr:septum formation protein Maf [Rhodospirillaceae bacterium]|tara:strand:- start:49 stop:645 length:597 start_codon:yes stop_codon:yes gene_type:complete
MNAKIILASSSEIRQKLFRNAGIPVITDPANIDENSIKLSLEKENKSHDEIVQILSDYKGINKANKWSDNIIISCDQILSFKGKILSKPKDIESAKKNLKNLSGSKHFLITASTIIENKNIVWRHLSKSEMFMRKLNDVQISSYINEVGSKCLSSVGGYMIEEQGIKLFNKINGDYFSILGIPLIEIINFLYEKNMIK